MRRFLTALPCLLLPWLAACTGPEAKLAIGYINSPRIMQQYHGTQTQRQRVAAQAQVWQRSLDSLTAQLGAAALPATARQAQVASYRALLRQKIQAASQQADQQLLREVNAYLKKYGAAHRYDFIFGANESGNIVFAADSRDLTAEVLVGLNQEYDTRRATR